MLNQESQEFAAQLEAPEEPSLKELCQLGAVVTRAKNTAMRGKKRAYAASFMGPVQPAKAAPKKGWLDNLFSFGENIVGKASKLAGRASRLSATYGGPVPLDKEIKRLTEMKQELRARISEADGLISGPVMRFLQAKTPASDLAARQVGDAARQTKAEAQNVLKTIDAAQAAAQAARRQILDGVPPLKAMAVFGVKKANADQQYSHARLRAMNMRESYQKALAETLIKPAKVVAGDYARAAGGSLIEFGRQAGEAAQQAGEIVKETGRGIKEATPLFRYLPYIALGGAALYLYSMGKGSGASFGRVLESYKRKE